MPLGHIDCSACLHAILLFPNLFTYAPNIVWCQFKSCFFMLVWTNLELNCRQFQTPWRPCYVTEINSNHISTFKFPVIWLQQYIPLQWRHSDRDGVSNHQPHHCLLKRLFRRRWKKTSKLRVTGLWEFTGDQWIPRTKGQERGKCFDLMTASWHHIDYIEYLLKCWMFSAINDNISVIPQDRRKFNCPYRTRIWRKAHKLIRYPP